MRTSGSTLRALTGPTTWAVAAALLVGIPASTAAADSPATLGEVTLVERGPGMDSGYTRLELRVELSDPDGFPDRITNFETQPYPVADASIDRSGAVVPVPTDRLPAFVQWDVFQRVSGTQNQGSWVATANVSSVAVGTVHVTSVEVTDNAFDVTRFEVAEGPHVEIGDAATAPWAYQVLSPPVRVVSGRERWSPSVRLVRRNGTPVPGARSVASEPGSVDVPFWAYGRTFLPRPQDLGTYPLTTSSSGMLVLPSYSVRESGLVSSVAGWGRGAGRYHTVTAIGILDPPVKWQARSSFASSGGAIVMTGNAWPAPSVHDAANPRVHLQRLVGRTWRTEATGLVRDNGRFTVSWAPPSEDAYYVRAYKPGGVEGSRTSVGTAGPAVLVRR